MMQQLVTLEIEQQIPLIRLLGQLIESNEVPIHLRNELGRNMFHILKNKQVAKMTLDEKVDANAYLRPLVKILHEGCQQNTQLIDYQTGMDDLQVHCATILTQMLALNNRKYYIPGETSENAKLRLKAIQSGILVALVYSYLNSQNERLKQLLQEELVERLDESDLQLQFEQYETSFGSFRKYTGCAQNQSTINNEQDIGQHALATQTITPMVTVRARYEG